PEETTLVVIAEEVHESHGPEPEPRPRTIGVVAIVHVLGRGTGSRLGGDPYSAKLEIVAVATAVLRGGGPAGGAGLANADDVIDVFLPEPFALVIVGTGPPPGVERRIRVTRQGGVINDVAGTDL